MRSWKRSARPFYADGVGRPSLVAGPLFRCFRHQVLVKRA